MKKLSKGFSLIEVLVCLLLISVVALLSTIITTQSLVNVNATLNKSISLGARFNDLPE